MSTSATQFSEADVDICNTKNKQKLQNGCRHPQHNFLKRMSTSVIPKKQKKIIRNGCRHLQLYCLKRMSTSTVVTKVNFNVYQ